MKKSKYLIPLVLGLFLILSMDGGLMAKDGGFKDNSSKGGFTGPGLDLTSVKTALTMRDDTDVVLKGKIIRSMGKEKYLFQDETGEIVIDIDEHVWEGQNVTPDDTIQITGEIDKEFMNDAEVDVHSISILK
jgi:uncharacterized protein (TIGR00156 family)